MSDFSILSIDHMKTKKKQICFAGMVQRYSTMAKAQQDLYSRPKSVELY